MATFFSDFFGVDPDLLDEYGAFNVSLLTDLPLFIDPFLLFHSARPEYKQLHDDIIKYLVFLRDKSVGSHVSEALLRAWYFFPEVNETWLGFTQGGNQGHGLGMDFAHALNGSLHDIFSDFGQERITASSHLEKVCLIKNGVGRDNISDFATNLIKDYLCTFTQTFAEQYLGPDQHRRVAIANAVFNYTTEKWETRWYHLPWVNAGHVILVPKDMLTRDENWINRTDMLRDFEAIPRAVSDQQLRAEINNYFYNAILRQPGKEPSLKEKVQAAARTIGAFPKLIDYYIRTKEDRGDEAEDISAEKVRITELVFNQQIQELQALLKKSQFYNEAGTTRAEALKRLMYLKDVIENKGGHLIFYVDGKPIRREADLQIMFRLVWFGTPSDVSREVNDGRGPADFKISRGARDKTIVELKLASNTQLRRNLQHQAELYQRASDAGTALKGIIYFTPEERLRLLAMLDDLGLTGNDNVVLIDARDDNKPSASKATVH